MDGELKFVIGMSVVVVAFTTMLVITCDKIEKKKCLTKYADFQPEYVDFITKCQIKYKGKTIPAEALRITVDN